MNITYPILIIALSMQACGSKKKVVTNTIPTLTITVPNQPTPTTEADTVLMLKVIRLSCASAVVQILNEPYKSVGQDWVPYNVRMKSPYTACFTVYNKCAIPEGVVDGAYLRAKIITKEQADKNKPCIACMMMDYPPEITKALEVYEVLKKTPIKE